MDGSADPGDAAVPSQSAGTCGGDAAPADYPRAAAGHENDDVLRTRILQIVEAAVEPASVRQLVLALRIDMPADYRQVRLVADALTADGELVRDKAGSAYRYRRNSDLDDRVAHHVAEHLSTADDPAAVVARAWELLGRRR